jgi:hypothetical protein
MSRSKQIYVQQFGSMIRIPPFLLCIKDLTKPTLLKLYSVTWSFFLLFKKNTIIKFGLLHTQFHVAISNSNNKEKKGIKMLCK